MMNILIVKLHLIFMVKWLVCQINKLPETLVEKPVSRYLARYMKHQSGHLIIICFCPDEAQYMKHACSATKSTMMAIRLLLLARGYISITHGFWNLSVRQVSDDILLNVKVQTSFPVNRVVPVYSSSKIHMC